LQLSENSSYQTKEYIFKEWLGKKKHILYPLLTLGIIFFIYNIFSIKVHTWESYYYSGSINHFIPVKDMAPPGQNLPIPYDDLICIYYTQHPALYFLVYLIHYTLFNEINPVHITQYLNILFGVFGLFGIYLILKKIFNNTLIACQGVFLMAWVDVYWYQSLSGEVYIAAFSFLSISMYFLLKSGNDNERSHSFFFMCIFYGIAVCFHFYALFFGLVITVDIVNNSNKFSLFFKKFFVFLVISALFFLAAYVVPYFLLTSISTFKELITLLFIHSKIWGIWQIPDYLMPIEILYSIGIGFKHILYAIFSGNNNYSITLRFIFGITIVIQLMNYFIKASKNRVSNLCLLWFFTYFITLTCFIHVPSVNDNWCLCIFPLILFFFYRCKFHLRDRKGKTILWIIIVNLFFINGTADIFPKTKVSEKEYFIAKDKDKFFSEYSKILFMGNHNIFIQAWYVFYKNKLSADSLSYIHPPYEYPHLFKYKKDLLRNVTKNLKKNKKMLLISAENKKWIRFTISLLRSSGYSIQPVLTKNLIIDPKTFKVSLGIIEEKVQLRYIAYSIIKANDTTD